MKKGHLIAAAISLVMFAWVIAHVGLSAMLVQLKAMRVALPIVLALSVLRLFLQSITWSASLEGEHVSVAWVAHDLLAGRQHHRPQRPGAPANRAEHVVGAAKVAADAGGTEPGRGGAAFDFAGPGRERAGRRRRDGPLDRVDDRARALSAARRPTHRVYCDQRR